MALKLITPPAMEPVTLAEARAQMHGYEDEDSLIQSYITAARQSSEHCTRRAYLSQVWELTLDRWPAKAIKLPFPPLISVASIKYKDQDGTETTWDQANYIVDADSEPAQVVLDYNESWPNETLYPVGAIKIRFSAGYPLYQGIVNTSGTAVTKITGDDFNTDWPSGHPINIAGETYMVSAVISTISLTLQTTAGDKTGAVYTANNVPAPLKQAILLRVAHMHENREPVIVGTSVVALPFAINALEAGFRVFNF